MASPLENDMSDNLQNPEDSNPKPTPQEQLEMRVLAMLLGETEEAETEAVQQLLQENPDLQSYAEKMQKSLGLVKESAKSLYSGAQSAPQQLSDDRRKTLENLWNEEQATPENVHSFPVEETPEPQRSGFQLHPFIPVAAAASVAILLGGVWFPKFLKEKADNQVAMSAQLPERQDAVTATDQYGSMPAESSEPDDRTPDNSTLHYSFKESVSAQTAPRSGKRPFADADKQELEVTHARDNITLEALALKPQQKSSGHAAPEGNIQVGDKRASANDHPFQANLAEGSPAPGAGERLEEMRKEVSDLSSQTRSLNLSVNELSAESLVKNQDELKSALESRTTRNKKTREDYERSASKSLSRAENLAEMPAPPGRNAPVPEPEPLPEVTAPPKVLPKPIVTESVTTAAPIGGGGKPNSRGPSSQPIAPPVNAPVTQAPPALTPRPVLPQEPARPTLPGITTKTQPGPENRRMPAQPFDDATETPPPATPAPPAIPTPVKKPAPTTPRPTTVPASARTRPPAPSRSIAPAQPAAATPVPADPIPMTTGRLDDILEKQKSETAITRYRQSEATKNTNAITADFDNREGKEKETIKPLSGGILLTDDLTLSGFVDGTYTHREFSDDAEMLEIDHAEVDLKFSASEFKYTQASPKKLLSQEEQMKVERALDRTAAQDTLGKDVFLHDHSLKPLNSTSTALKGLKDLELSDQQQRLKSVQQGQTSALGNNEKLRKQSEIAEAKSDKETDERFNKRALMSKLEKAKELPDTAPEEILEEAEEEKKPDVSDKDGDVWAEDLGIPTPIELPEPKPEVVTAQSPFSTFSLNVTDASFRLCEASLLNGQLPPPHIVRAEEFINAFDYRDPAPVGGKALSFAWDRSRHPFAHNRDLVRFSIQTAAEGRQGGQPLNLVLTIDNSGSMERADRVAILQQALKVLSTKLRPQDKVSVIAFARTPRLWMNGANGVEAGKKLADFDAIVPQGGTNIEAALNLAYEVAGKHFISNGNNRVILLTDGAANLGNVVPKSLRKTVEAQRKKAIALDCFGIGWDGYNDHLMEALARNGDGRYAFLNSPKDVERDFARKLAGALTLAAADVKVQVVFNPKRVKTHRQIGYLRHQLKKEDFRNNAVDAAEIGSAESGNALYVLQIDPKGSGPIGRVHVRYREPATGKYKETSWPLPHRSNPPSLDQASSAMRLAASAATFAEWLARSPYAGDVDLMKLQQYLAGLQTEFPSHSPVQSLLQMIRAASLSK